MRLASGPIASLIATVSTRSLNGVLVPLENEDARTFSEDEPIAPRIEGTAGAFWFVVASRQRAHARKRCQRQRCQRRLASTSEHRVSRTGLNCVIRLAHR